MEKTVIVSKDKRAEEILQSIFNDLKNIEIEDMSSLEVDTYNKIARFFNSPEVKRKY